MEKRISQKHRKIGVEVQGLLLVLLLIVVLLMGAGSIASLFSTMKISVENSQGLGKDGIVFSQPIYKADEIVAVLCIFLLGTYFIKKITDSIRKLTEQVAHIDGGNLKTRIAISSGDEIESLGNAFNMLPQAKGAFSDREEFSLYASMIPAKGVGGDFYDFFLLDDDQLVLIMADVSGKGTPAALFKAASRTLLRSHISSETELKQAVADVNQGLCENNIDGMFVTAWVGILTISTGRIRFVNAGHCRPLLQRADGTCRYEQSFGGLVLAGMEESRYHEMEIQLQEGDTLFLYTDGVTETKSSKNELYGETRLKEFVEKLGKKTPEELLNAVWMDINIFQGDAEQFDDLAMLAVAYHGSGFIKKTGRPQRERIGEYSSFIKAQLRENQIPGAVEKNIMMAFDELYTNICLYSGADEAGVEVKILPQKEIIIRFTDNGIPFNPLDKTDPDISKPLEDRETGGLGIYLVKKRMDDMEYEYQDGKNCLTIRKYWK